MTTSPHPAPDEPASHPVHTALYLLGRLVLLLIAAAILYAAWMVIRNWGAVGV